MIVPWSMKIRVTAPRDAPIETRIAMSLCFSITMRMRVATMLRAATITMRPIVMPIAIFSSHRAEKRLWLRSIQLLGMYSSPRATRISLEILRTA